MSFWPEPHRAAVSLTFDDGLQSQLNRAVPILDAAGLRATFYLNPRSPDPKDDSEAGWRAALASWQPVQTIGHAMGNHTVVHPCSLNTDEPWQQEKTFSTGPSPRSKRTSSKPTAGRASPAA